LLSKVSQKVIGPPNCIPQFGVGEGLAEPEVRKSKLLPLANAAKNNRNGFIGNPVIGDKISCQL
jgi:hypothetical protein